MPFGVRGYECIYCGSRFTRADSVAANTPELMSNMYCSLECHDKDTEQIDNSIKELQEQQAVKDAEFKEEQFQIIEAAGFRLKVPIKKEN